MGSARPAWATLPKLSEPKLLPNTALNKSSAAAWSKLPIRFIASAAPVKMPEAESMLIDVSSVPGDTSTASSPVLAL